MTPPILLDNTILTNFALVNRVDLVFKLWGTNCTTTTAVMTEYQTGVTSGLLPANAWIRLIPLMLDETETRFATSLPPRLGAGERTCIAVAVHRKALFVSDDRDARLAAKKNGIPVTGTLGVLASCVHEGYISLSEGNFLLTQMIKFGYRSPFASLDSLV